MRGVPGAVSARIPSMVAAAVLAAATPAVAQKLVPAVGSLVAHDVNDVFLRVSNRGGFGLAVQEFDVGNFPRGTPNRYLFGAGLWVGGIGDVDADGQPDTVTTIGFNPSNVAVMEWVEGGLGFDRDDPRFRVLDSSNPADVALFPGEPVAAQELFAIYSDRVSVFTSGAAPSIPLGVEVRQRSFAFTEEGLDTTIFFQWDMRNISDRIRATGYPIVAPWTGIVLDPDIGEVNDDVAAPLEVDGAIVLVIWDVDFATPLFVGRPGFLAIVPMVEPATPVTVSQLSSPLLAGVQQVPQTDAGQYRALAGIPPNAPTTGAIGFDLRALVGWAGPADLPAGALHRTAAAFVWAEADLEAVEGEGALNQDEPVLQPLVTAIRAAREAYAERLADLPALLEFPGEPLPPEPAEVNQVRQNYPNPFRDSTTIEYALTAPAAVRLEVLDLAGARVARLVEGPVAPGAHTAFWNGRSDAGREMPPGVYVIRLTTGGNESVVRALKLP